MNKYILIFGECTYVLWKDHVLRRRDTKTLSCCASVVRPKSRDTSPENLNQGEKSKRSVNPRTFWGIGIRHFASFSLVPQYHNEPAKALSRTRFTSGHHGGPSRIVFTARSSRSTGLPVESSPPGTAQTFVHGVSVTPQPLRVPRAMPICGDNSIGIASSSVGSLDGSRSVSSP